MLIRRGPGIKYSEITDRRLYANRREFLAQASAGAIALAAPWLAGCNTGSVMAGEKIQGYSKNSKYNTTEKLTPYQDVTTYNNFYEFGTDKESPAQQAPKFLKPRPWTFKVEGEVKKPRSFAIDELIKMFPLEERIYRLRCVEAWSAVVPWIGFPLGELIKAVEPTPKAKFVEFKTLYDPKQMPGQQFSIFGKILDWPYVEGLRLDEAMHPLSILAVGLYGEVMPHQNGAPIRLVVPWKYGFKGIKSIVQMRLVEKQPVGSWERANAQEYGFYSNVNPDVSHPRWSQAKERRLGEFFKRPTLMFNGYGDQVASLYSGMDLRKNY